MNGVPFSPSRSVESLHAGDHVCLAYHTDDQRYAALAQYVADGIARNEQVICYTDEESPSDLLDALCDRGLDVARHVRDSRLFVATSLQSYLAAGRFDPDHVIENWIEAVIRAMQSRCSGVRVAGNMGWALRKVAGAERLAEYEERVQRELFDRYPAIGLCEFDLRRFGPHAHDQIRAMHPRGTLTVPSGR